MTNRLGTALFVLSTVGLVVGVVVHRTRLLAGENQFEIATSDVTGLAAGVPVRLHGYEVGRVTTIRPTRWLPPEFSVTVALRADVELAASVRVEIEPGLVGGAGEVRLVQGDSSEVLEPGAVLQGSRVASLPERAGNTLGLVDHTLERSDHTFQKIDGAIDDAQSAIRNVEAVVEDIGPDLKRGTRQFAEVAVSASQVADRAAVLLAPEGDVAKTLQATQAELKELHDLMVGFDPDEATKVGKILDEVNRLVAETNNMATHLRERPLKSILKGMPPAVEASTEGG